MSGNQRTGKETEGSEYEERIMEISADFVSEMEISMDKPVLVVMAAGMGSRYGGLKQIDPITPEGDKIIDFSVYDAYRAGFEKVIFIIKRENRKDFEEAVSARMSNRIKVEYAYQDLSDIPSGCTVPKGRNKPYGTAHAVLSARNLLNGPFAVINADDFYGREAFLRMYNYLCQKDECDGQHALKTPVEYAMVGFRLGNTLTENGSVSRGICQTDREGFLSDITEHTKIYRTSAGIVSETESGNVDLSEESVTSMNFWGFSIDFVDALRTAFDTFFEKDIPNDPEKAECYLPFVVDEMIQNKRAKVRVLTSEDKWFGVTYREDKPMVSASIAELKQRGVYPQYLWD